MPNDIFLNRCSAERYFPESSYSRTSFSRICVQPSIIFPKYWLGEKVISFFRFKELETKRNYFFRNPILFARTSFSRNCMDPNVISPNTMWSYEYLPCYLKDHERYVWIAVTITSTFWLILIDWTFWKWCSAKRRFEKMAFG